MALLQVLGIVAGDKIFLQVQGSFAGRWMSVVRMQGMAIWSSFRYRAKKPRSLYNHWDRGFMKPSNNRAVILSYQIVVAVIVYLPPVWFPERVVFVKSRSI